MLWAQKEEAHVSMKRGGFTLTRMMNLKRAPPSTLPFPRMFPPRSTTRSFPGGRRAGRHCRVGLILLQYRPGCSPGRPHPGRMSRRRSGIPSSFASRRNGTGVCSARVPPHRPRPERSSRPTPGWGVPPPGPSSPLPVSLPARPANAQRSPYRAELPRSQRRAAPVLRVRSPPPCTMWGAEPRPRV